MFRATSPPIGQPLAFAALYRFNGTLAIVHRATIPTERDFIAVAGKMFARNVMEAADDRALQQGVPAFRRIGVDAIARKFATPVVNRRMLNVHIVFDALIRLVLVAVDVSAGRDIGDKVAADRAINRIGEHGSADASLTLH